FKKNDFERFQEKARHCAAQVVGVKKSSIVALVAVLKGFEKELQQQRFAVVSLPEAPAGFKGTPKQLMDELAREALALAEKESEEKARCAEFAAQQLPGLYCAFDEMLSEKEKIEASKKLLSTRHAFLVQGWVKETDAERVRAAIEKNSEGVCEIILESPKEGDKPPVELKNSAILRPFEIITHGFGLPSYFEQDPTPILAPFFFVFTGLCLTDAGYGVVLALLSLVLWFKYKELRNFFALLMLIGVSTVIFGALVGGWFGGLLPIQPLWFDAMKNPLAFLALAFALGFIHIVAGLIVELFDSLKQRNFFAAFADQFLWIALLFSIACFALVSAGVMPQTASGPVVYAACGSAFGLVLTQGRHEKNVFKKLFFGVLSLYNLIGYFSDVMSYSRLLALGLSTGIVAMIVNQLAILSLGIGFGPLGIIIAVAILVFGHLANLVLNALGAYVHSLRLQYVEFFPKFFSGGGESFKPLSQASVYTKPLRAASGARGGASGEQNAF
ncbi:MAG: V-type ATPase 116kDa subunit family protein, partial [Candidatus Micrarchaeota archaeon]